MIKVITYGTYDLLHYGHIRLLQRAKALGDYLIVGVTTDDFDQRRGKINVKQSLMERIENVKSLGIADEIIVEEYEGQKIDDIKRYNIDIFTVGSDWAGKFDYLSQYCEVIYLSRTEGISSSNIRAENRKLHVGIIGELTNATKKFIRESAFVNGIEVVSFCIDDVSRIQFEKNFAGIYFTSDLEEFFKSIDAVYVASHPEKHYEHVKMALINGKHVLCETPISIVESQCEELFELAVNQKCILMEGIKTAYSTAYTRLILLIKSGKIGDVVSVDSNCTSMRDLADQNINLKEKWNSMCEWGPIAMLPIFQILGINYVKKAIVSHFLDHDKKFDGFTKIDFLYKNAVASIKVAKSAKSEGELVISGTKGYIYVPAPWWKTDYFELRYENIEDNQRYFYQLDGEGIRYEIVAFLKTIENKNVNYINKDISLAIARLIEAYYNKEDLIEI